MMRRIVITAGLLLAMFLGQFARNQMKQAAAQDALSSGRDMRLLADANSLSKRMVKDLASRGSLSDEQQDQLIAALRPAAVAASLQGNAWEEEAGLVRPRHLLRSEAVWKASEE